jgi:hypothetical protein
MRTFVMGALLAMVAGCGGAALRQEPRPIRFAVAGPSDAPSVVVGSPRIVGERVNPLQPVHLTADGGAITVTYARRGREGRVVGIDPRSLELRGGSEYTYAGMGDKRPSMHVQTVGLDTGGSLMCWTEGNLESGSRAIAQAFGADGSPVGAAVVISPEAWDVVGAPQVTTVDGRHVVAMFPAVTGDAVQLVAVSLEGL